MQIMVLQLKQDCIHLNLARQRGWNHHHHHHRHLFLKLPFLQKVGLDVCPDMRPLHTSLNTAHSECKPGSFVSSFTHSLLSSYPCPHISPLPPPYFYRPTPNHLRSYVPHAQTTSIYHASPLSSIFTIFLTLPSITLSSTFIACSSSLMPLYEPHVKASPFPM